MLDKFNQWRWKLERRLIDDWRSAYKFSSVWIMSGSGIILVTWTADPDLIREIIPARWLHLVLAVVVLSGIIARITKKPDELRRPQTETRVWEPHLDYAGEPMQPGEFREPPPPPTNGATQ